MDEPRFQLVGRPTYEDIATPVPELVHRLFGPQSTLSVTVSPKQGIRIALRLLRESGVAAIRRTTVTFTAGQD